MSDLKKYPIIYKGKSYEIRWEKHTYYGEVMGTYINLYQVTPTIFNIKRYKKVYSNDLKTIELALKMNNIFENNPQYYVEQAKCVFNIWFFLALLFKKV